MNDLTGERFGKLRVIESLGVDYRHNRRWLCKCDCGKVRRVTTEKLKSGEITNCGCYRKRRTAESISRTNVYQTWKGMIYRCENSNNPEYKNYGGRGIKVCSEWHGYDNFKKWFEASGFQSGLTIDRINNNGNYEPSNCRWATKEEQGNNMRKNIFYNFNGNKMTIPQIGRETGLSRSRLYALINYSNLSVEEAIKREKERIA